jgi:flagellin
LISAISASGLGLTATFGTATQAGTGAVATAGASLYGGGSGADTGIIISGQDVGTGTSAGEIGSLTVGGTALDPLAGTLNITGADGTSHTITLGQADSTDNINDLAATINADNYGITASVNGGTLTFTSASSTASVSGTNLTDAVTAAAAAPAVGGAGFGAFAAGNDAAGSKTITLGAGGDIFTGGTFALTGENGLVLNLTLGVAGVSDNITDLAKTINNWAAANASTGMSATVTSPTVLTISNAAGAATQQAALVLTAPTDDTVAAATSVSLAGMPTTSTASSSTLGTFTLGGVGDSITDVLNGALTIGANTITLGGTGTTDTLQDLAKYINTNGYGVTATYSQTSKNIVFTSSNSALTVGYAAAAGNGDQTIGTGTVTYAAATPVTTAEDYYSLGIASAGGISDKSTAVGGGPTYGGTVNTGFTTDTDSTAGIAAISYTDAAGESLSGTDLTNQTNAQAALNDLNQAITDVAAQDGYIGAQINTLNSISQVMSTQKENVVSAQNAIQATDYASATSNMSKYEILSQTGIAALAQANSVEQEVTKLLQ